MLFRSDHHQTHHLKKTPQTAQSTPIAKEQPPNNNYTNGTIHFSTTKEQPPTNNSTNLDRHQTPHLSLIEREKTSHCHRHRRSRHRQPTIYLMLQTSHRRSRHRQPTNPCHRRPTNPRHPRNPPTHAIVDHVKRREKR